MFWQPKKESLADQMAREEKITRERDDLQKTAKLREERLKKLKERNDLLNKNRQLESDYKKEEFRATKRGQAVEFLKRNLAPVHERMKERTKITTRKKGGLFDYSSFGRSESSDGGNHFGMGPGINWGHRKE